MKYFKCPNPKTVKLQLRESEPVYSSISLIEEAESFLAKNPEVNRVEFAALGRYYVIANLKPEQKTLPFKD